MYGLMLDNVIPEQLTVNLSEPAERDIRAPITVEDRAATLQRQEEAVNSIESQTKHNTSYEEDRVQQVNDIFSVIDQARSGNDSSDEENEEDVLSIDEKK